jgi:WhiB family redox-sensing transcriptional regulator
MSAVIRDKGPERWPLDNIEDAAGAARPGSWLPAAACFGDPDPDAWFADVREKARVEHALATCAGCPVRVQCLDFAMRIGAQYGTWGGLTEQQRAEQLRAWRAS